MKAEIETLKVFREDKFVLQDQRKAMDHAIQVMEAWGKLRNMVATGFAVHQNAMPEWIAAEIRQTLLREMDSLVPPEPVDELDQLREWVTASLYLPGLTNHISVEQLDTEITRIKAARKKHGETV